MLTLWNTKGPAVKKFCLLYLSKSKRNPGNSSNIFSHTWWLLWHFSIKVIEHKFKTNLGTFTKLESLLVIYIISIHTSYSQGVNQANVNSKSSILSFPQPSLKKWIYLSSNSNEWQNRMRWHILRIFSFIFLSYILFVLICHGFLNRALRQWVSKCVTRMSMTVILW